MHNLLKNKIVLIGSIGIIAITIGFVASTMLLPQQAKGSAQNCPEICVLLTEDGMNPNTLAIKKGQYVQFMTADGKRHEIGIGGGEDTHSHSDEHEHLSDYTSGNFGPDEAWRVQFKEVGTYKLHDHKNPKLTILVVVYDPSNPSKIN
jgi:hypothetical protein